MSKPKEIENSYKEIKRIFDVLEKYEIQHADDLEDILDEYHANNCELFVCPQCLLKCVRETDRFCCECGSKMEE